MRAVLRQRGAQDASARRCRRSPTRCASTRSASGRRSRRRPAAAAPTSSPRCPATRGWAWASPTSARPSTASCRRWPAAAGSPASASTRCSASSRSRPALDLRKDVLGWMGDAGVFVGGTTSADLGGALVIKTTDPAKTKRTMAVLERFARSRAPARRSPSLHGQRHRRRASRPRTRPGRPSRSPSPAIASWSRSAARTCWRQAISPGEQLGSSPALHRRGGQARQRPAALVLSRLHPGDEADRVLRRRRTPASRRPSPTSTPSARSSPAPRTRARASPGRASS